MAEVDRPEFELPKRLPEPGREGVSPAALSSNCACDMAEPSKRLVKISDFVSAPGMSFTQVRLMLFSKSTVSTLVTFENQSGICTAETKAVRHDGIQFHIVNAFQSNGNIAEFRIQVFNVG